MRTLCFISHKGGVGKTTLASALSVAGQELGFSVGVLDLDAPTLGLTSFVGLRRSAGLAAPVLIQPPMLPATRTPTSREAGRLIGSAVTEAKARGLGLLLIDLEAVTNALWLKAAACLVADRVITPISDSPLDIEAILPASGEGDLAQFIRSAGERRPDWVVVRNRSSQLRTRLADTLSTRLNAGAAGAGFRILDGLSDRVAYREMFLHGRTPLDPPADGRPLSMSAIAARSELRRLASEILEGAPRAMLRGWTQAAGR